MNTFFFILVYYYLILVSCSIQGGYLGLS